MKKTIGLFLTVLIITLILPFGVKADTTYTSQTLDEAATAEGITYSHGDFTNSSDKATIYLFRGAGCSHCYEFLTYLESIVPDYGKYFNVVTYEVWNNTDNADLMSKVAKVFGDEASGVPYIIIGDKTYVGYASSMDDEIKQSIMDLYNSTDRYDVMNHLGETKDTTSNDSTTATSTTTNTATVDNKDVIWTVAIATTLLIIVYYVKSTNDKREVLENISKIKVSNKENTETKKTVKK